MKDNSKTERPQKPKDERSDVSYVEDLLKFVKELLKSTDVEKNKIFEDVLSQRNKYRYIAACIIAGLDVNYVNTELNKAAINYAADSLDSDNIEALAYYGRNSTGKCTVKLDFQYNGETALISLIKGVNPENIDDTISCVIILVHYGASLEKPDSEGRTPLQLIQQNNSIDIRSYLMLAILSAIQSPDFDYEKNLKFVALETISNARLNKIIELGNWELIWCLLEALNFNQDIVNSCLETIVSAYVSDDSSSKAYKNCLNECLEKRKKKINEEDTGYIQKLMKTAVKHENSLAKAVLLRYGSKINCEVDNYNISDIGVDILKEHFDHCITSDKKDLNHAYLKITFSLKNFLNNNKMDLDPLFQMANDKEFHPLLEHPLINTFMKLKWLCFRKFYFVHFLIFIGFNIAIILQAFLRFPTRIQFKELIWLLDLSCAGIALFMIIETLLAYFIVSQKPKITDICLIPLLILNSIEFLELFGGEIHRFIAIFCIMLMVLKLVVLISALPIHSISTHMLMLEEVSKSFAKCMVNYSIFLLTFAICLYVLYGTRGPLRWRSESNQFTNNTNGSNNTNENSPKLFTLTQPHTVIPSTLVMFFGQYDMDTVFDSFSNFWILLLFMIMAMIITNLLSSLAIHDTQEIMSHAKINSVICRLELIKKYDAAMRINWRKFKPLQHFLLKLVNLHNECSYDGIVVYPNDEKNAPKITYNDSVILCDNLKRKCYIHSDFKLNPDIIANALDIIKKHKLQEVEEQTSENIMHKYEKISNLIEGLQKQFNNFEQKFDNRLKC